MEGGFRSLWGWACASVGSLTCTHACMSVEGFTLLSCWRLRSVAVVVAHKLWDTVAFAFTAYINTQIHSTVGSGSTTSLWWRKLYVLPVLQVLLLMAKPATCGQWVFSFIQCCMVSSPFMTATHKSYSSGFQKLNIQSPSETSLNSGRKSFLWVVGSSGLCSPLHWLGFCVHDERAVSSLDRGDNGTTHLRDMPQPQW